MLPRVCVKLEVGSCHVVLNEYAGNSISCISILSSVIRRQGMPLGQCRAIHCTRIELTNQVEVATIRNHVVKTEEVHTGIVLELKSYIYLGLFVGWMRRSKILIVVEYQGVVGVGSRGCSCRDDTIVSNLIIIDITLSVISIIRIRCLWQEVPSYLRPLVTNDDAHQLE